MNADKAIRRGTAGAVLLAVTNGVPGHIREAQKVFAGQIAAGEIPTVRKIRSEMGVGSHRAQQVRAHIRALARP